MSDINNVNENRLERVFNYTIRGMILVAFAECKLHWKQKALLMESIRMIRTNVTAEEGLSILENISTSLEGLPDFMCMDLFASASKLSDHDKRIILGLCIKIAFEDWKLSTTETEMILKIADWIKINSANRNILVNEILQAMGSEDNENLQYSGIENLERIRL